MIRSLELHHPGRGEELGTELTTDHAHDRASIKLWGSDGFRVGEHREALGE